MNYYSSKEYLADYEEGAEAYLQGTPYDDSQSVGWQDGWEHQNELQSRSYSPTRL